MNREIARLLCEAGVTEPFDWRDIVIRQNYAMVPAPSGSLDRGTTSLGFNLNILLRGSPAFVAKCRATGEPELKRSTAIRNCLAGNRPYGLSVSEARIASSSRMTVQVSRFIRGANLGEVARSLSSTNYAELLRIVLDGNAELSRLAMSAPALLESRPPVFSLASIASAVVDDAARLAELDEHEHAALGAAVLAAGDMPSRPQHGDFWWANMLLRDGQIWVLDFDSYGEINVPLFDDLTFTLGTLGLRAESLAAAVEWLGSQDSDARTTRSLLTERAETDGLNASQIDGVMAFYLAQMAYDVHRRAGEVYGAPHVSALRYAARCLAAGGQLHPQP